ncbi:MAG: hypothetical protein ACRD1C_10115 [Terriglobales bacterium]
MPRFAWDSDKDARLRATRGIGFEEIVFQMESGNLIEILEHPQAERYPGQRVFVVWCRDYAYLVLFVKSDEVALLKTIIPSRRVTRRIRQASEAHED